MQTYIWKLLICISTKIFHEVVYLISGLWNPIIGFSSPRMSRDVSPCWKESDLKQTLPILKMDIQTWNNIFISWIKKLWKQTSWILTFLSIITNVCFSLRPFFLFYLHSIMQKNVLSFGLQAGTAFFLNTATYSFVYRAPKKRQNARLFIINTYLLVYHCVELFSRNSSVPFSCWTTNKSEIEKWISAQESL